MNEKVEAVQRMQDYIETHLTDKITFADLAKAACFSPWYSARIFKEYTGYAPADYIRRLKLSKSALRLRDETIKVIEIAYEMGFESVDGYQRAFYREFGCNPKPYAKHPIPLALFIPYGVKFKEPKRRPNNMERAKTVFIQVIEKPARKAIIKRGIKAEDYWEYCEEVGCDVWGILSSIKSLSKEPVCLWLPQSYRLKDTSFYVQGVEVELDYQKEGLEDFDVIELPACKYLMFQGEPFKEEDYCEAIEDVQQAMDSYDPSLIGFSWDSSQPRIQLEPVGKRGYIEMRAIH